VFETKEEEAEISESVSRVCNGEHNVFNEIARRYESRIFSLVLMMIRDRSAAEEVTQDTFLRAFSNLRKFDLNRPFYPWLATIATRLGINWVNRTGIKRQRETSYDELIEPPGTVSTPLDELVKRQSGITLWDHVAKLPQGERTAILLFYKQELTVAEIASVLGVTKGTVKTFLHRGRLHLKTRFEPTGDTQ